MMVERHGEQGTVVVVDDTDVIADMLRRHLVSDGHTVEVAHDGPSGLKAVRRVSPDLVLLDVMMPGMNGFDVCRRLKRDPVTRLTPVVLVTTLDTPDDRIQGVEAGADDFLTKPIDVRQLKARVRSLLRLKHYTDDLDSAEEVMMSLGRTVEARDPSTEGHCFRALRPVRSIVRHHHERLDGSGYPDRLVGAAIPLLAQVVGVVDVFDALTTARSYKPALSIPAALESLRDEAARGLHDPAMVDVLVALHLSGALDRALIPARHRPRVLGGALQ